jgi:hypothetical protein
MEKEYYDAKEVADILKTSITTVYRKAKSGEIPSIGKRPNIKFPKKAIDLHAKLQERNRGKGFHLEFSQATNADIWQTIENSTRIYGENDIIPYEQMMEWRLTNDEMSMSLKDEGAFAGCTTFLPVEEKYIMPLLKDEIRERDLPTEAIKKWTDRKLSVYIANVAIVPTNDAEKDRQRGRFILEHTIKWAIALYHQYDIKNYYAIGATPEGQKICEQLGFEEIVSVNNGERKGYVLRDFKKPTALMQLFLSEIERGTAQVQK